MRNKLYILLAVCMIAMLFGCSEKGIGIEAAKKIALENAGFTEDDVTFIKALKTNIGEEDDKVKYSIAFFKGLTEYDYRIDTATGEILSYDNDIEDFDVNTYPVIPAPSQ